MGVEFIVTSMSSPELGGAALPPLSSFPSPPFHVPSADSKLNLVQAVQVTQELTMPDQPGAFSISCASQIDHQRAFRVQLLY